LSRVINPERAGKERNRLARSVVGALRRLGEQVEVNDETRDLAAYIALALYAITDTIDSTVEAWEKRGYWVKADRYRMEWIWTENYGARMQQAVLAEDWGAVVQLAVAIGGKLEKFNGLKPKKGQEYWAGSLSKLRERSASV